VPSFPGRSFIVLRDYCGGVDVRGNHYLVDIDQQLQNALDFPQGNYPVVMFVRGSAWESGDYFYIHMSKATARGYVAIVINHRYWPFSRCSFSNYTRRY